MYIVDMTLLCVKDLNTPHPPKCLSLPAVTLRVMAKPSSGLSTNVDSAYKNYQLEHPPSG